MYPEPIARLREIFSELRKLCSFQTLREIIEAAHGVRVIRLCIAEDRILQLVRLLEHLELWIDLHDRKQLLFEDKGKGGWISGYGIELALEHPYTGYIHLYAGRNPDDVLRAKKAEHSSDIDQFGKLLGYPACCRDFYLHNLEEAENAQGDFVLQLLRQSTRMRSVAAPDFPFWTNIAAQYFNSGLISFYPCSFFCQEAIGISKRALGLLNLYDPALAQEKVSIARSPILYTEYEGIYRLQNARQEKDFIFYDGIESSLTGVIGTLLQAGTHLQIHSPNKASIFCGNERLARLESPTLAILRYKGDQDAA